MPVTDYRPKVGETIFVSLHGNCPMLITVTGFHYHSYLKEEVMDFDRLSGRSDWAGFKENATFFPEIPTDQRYLYVLVQHEDREDSWGFEIEEGFFFSPEDAFSHLEGITTGKVQHEHAYSTDPDDFTIEVRKVI